ncbi:hypothetical protein ElyMa_001810600 [Elysia marginata]|uniref:Uncharacterized protein n=1 Tax=Elysia marginata TaxID=1093978 RepID=A0AAV4EGA3_9GAST|nr:hypothetical protein ElyMa_001810600 [Elysia marginata]
MSGESEPWLRCDLHSRLNESITMRVPVVIVVGTHTLTGGLAEVPPPGPATIIDATDVMGSSGHKAKPLVRRPRPGAGISATLMAQH